MRLLVILVTFASLGRAQLGTSSTGMFSSVVAIPAAVAATYVTLKVDSSTSGGDIIDVVTSNSQVIVSLILPNGVEVTAANAAALGFAIDQQSKNPLTPTSSGVFTPFDALGFHTTFGLPPNTPGGIYQLKANSLNVATSTILQASYYSLSGVRVTFATDKPVYSPASTVGFAATIINDITPVTGATVTATIVPPVSLNGQASIGVFQLVSQSTAGGFTTYTYSASLTNNTAGSVALATAKLRSPSPTINILGSPYLVFSSIGAGGVSPSSNTFTVRAPMNTVFSPTALSWDITTTGPPVTLTLVDAGQGAYTGSYNPIAVGEYTVALRLTGSAGGAAYDRSSATSFKVVPPAANFVNVTEAAVDADANGKTESVILSAHLNVLTSGTYMFKVSLAASNGKAASVSRTVTLATGSQQIDASFSASQILAFGVGGPYQRRFATVTYFPPSETPITVARIVDAGPTAPYTLSSLESDAGSLYFTAQNSATGVTATPGPGYDALLVKFGVYSSEPESCVWSGQLRDAAGKRIQNVIQQGSLSAGTGSISLRFNGLLVARSIGGPYTVGPVTLECGSTISTPDPAITIQGFSPSQFKLTSPNFVLSLSGPSPIGNPGTQIDFPLVLTSVGAFDDRVTFTTAGLPAGVTASFSNPSLVGFGPTKLTLTTPSGLGIGTFPFIVGYWSGVKDKRLPLVLSTTASTQVVTPTFSPAAGAPPQTVSITTPTSGASIRYTTNGSVPGPNVGTLYTGPITVTSTTTIKAIAYAPGLTNSAVASATF